MSERTSVGLDVHPRSVVAAAIDNVTGEVCRAELAPAHERVIGWIQTLPGPAAAAYEAGPTGFGLARGLQAASIECVVAAPSKILRPAGDRVKNDRRDALLLARLLRLGELVPVRIPTPAEETARDLVRARDDVRGDLMRARHRLSKLLLRHNRVYEAKAWTQAHDRWLRRQAAGLDDPALRMAFDTAYETVLATTARRDRLDTAIEAMAADSEFTPVVSAGVPSWGVHADRVRSGCRGRRLGPVHRSHHRRLPRPGSVGGLVGIVTQARVDHQDWQQPRPRLLVEAARHHRRTYRTPSASLRARWAYALPAATARGNAGNHRLHRRWQSFDARNKQPSVANVAIARELAGWCWSLAVMDG